MAYILFIGYMSTHLVLRILSNPNISIGLHTFVGVIFFLSHVLIITWLFFIYVVHTLNSVTKRSNTVTWGWEIDLKTNRKRLKKNQKIDVNFYLNVLFRTYMYLYVVNPLASHVSCIPLIKVDTHFLCSHIFHVNENLEILSIKACFWDLETFVTGEL